MDFKYNEQGDYFECPTGVRLEFGSERKTGRRSYHAPDAECGKCPLRDRCCKSKQGKGRVLTTDKREGERRRMVEKMEHPESKEIYDKRKVIVEPAFGQIKNTGFRGFSVRGAAKVAAEFSLVSLAHNLKKMVKAAKTGQIRQENEGWFSVAV